MIVEFERQPQAYTLDFDRRPGLSPLFIKHQLETHIGERFNVLLSTTRYEIKDGRILGEGSDEPFADVLERGRNYRRLYGNPIDRGREQAEVIGFQKTENIMVDPQTAEDTQVLSFSKKGGKGSAYQHNFYDIFTKKHDENGFYVEARRYSSALGDTDCAKFYLELGFNGQGEVANDAFFLANPIVVNDPRFKTPDDLHRYLHRDHDFTTVEEFKRILKGAQASILRYAYNPTPSNFNRALNYADIQGGFLKTDVPNIDLGFIPVRQVMTGCGFSGGSDTSPFSLSEFGTSSDKYGSLNFDCPHCKQTNRRKPDQLIANCKHCGKDVRC